MIASASRDFGRNVVAGLRLAAFMRVGAEDIKASWSQLVALIALGLVATFVADLATVGAKGQFVFYNVPGVLFYVPLILVASWSLACLARRPEQTLTLMIALSALVVPLDIVRSLYSILYRDLPSWMRQISYLAYYLPHVWLVLAAAVGAIRILAIRLRTVVPALLIAAIVIGLPQAMVWRGQLWTPVYDGNDRSYRALSSEDAFYLQPKLLERELAALKPGRKGTIDLYFVGLAGYARQDVFMREVNSISKLFRERFDADGHTVRLINNAKTVAEAPIASVTALRATLARLAEVMDRDEDVLFLFLTSHGSQEHRFSLEFWPVNFNPLDPKALRQLLDDSGIKRRVIVVSSCYSGGFIDPLKDENSLVITASAANRNSFGCSNEADFTYFGKAYFDQALRETYSFIEAFEKAKPLIAEREKKEDYDGSEPQIFIGENIGPPLAELEKRLKGGQSLAGKPGDGRAKAATAPRKYVEFVNLWIRPDLLATYRKECLRGMAEGSPSYYVKRDPDYFGGLNENSRHWPRLIAAWTAYSEDYCAATNNESSFRGIYLESWRRSLDVRDLNTAMIFLQTDAGRRFVKAANEASVDVTRRALELNRTSTDRALKRYQDEQMRINADFKRDRQATRKN